MEVATFFLHRYVEAEPPPSSKHVLQEVAPMKLLQLLEQSKTVYHVVLQAVQLAPNPTEPGEPIQTVLKAKECVLVTGQLSKQTTP